jgi:hypothetical protein
MPMKMPKFSRILLAALGLIVSSAAFGQGTPLPWGEQSDMAAWETFVQVVAPSGNPQNTNVEFETWANDQDVYGTTPPLWPGVGAAKRLQVSVLGAIRHGTRLRALITPSECTQDYDKPTAKAAGFPADGCIGEEVRRNWATFQYIVANDLYSKAGFAKAFANGLKVDLPADAIEFKGDWVRVTDVMKWLHLSEQQVNDLYYTNTATAGSTTTKFALVSFHFSTKQIKDWVWADFEHEKNPGRCDDIGCHDDFGAAVANVPPKPLLWQQYGDCKKTAAVTKMFTNAGINPVWQNYCLKGSQITFVKADGKPGLLGNSVIEAINAGVPIPQSSCITCHAYASFNKDGDANGAAAGANYTGNVDKSKLQGWSTNDFIWGALFAQ